jgi:hypothetical protein
MWLLIALAVIILVYILYVFSLSMWTAKGQVTIQYWVESLIQLIIISGSAFFYYTCRYKRLSLGWSRLHVGILYFALLIYPLLDQLLFSLIDQLVSTSAFNYIVTVSILVGNAIYYGGVILALVFWWLNWKLSKQKTEISVNDSFLEVFIESTS